MRVRGQGQQVLAPVPVCGRQWSERCIQGRHVAECEARAQEHEQEGRQHGVDRQVVCLILAAALELGQRAECQSEDSRGEVQAQRELAGQKHQHQHHQRACHHRQRQLPDRSAVSQHVLPEPVDAWHACRGPQQGACHRYPDGDRRDDHCPTHAKSAEGRERAGALHAFTQQRSPQHP